MMGGRRSRAMNSGEKAKDFKGAMKRLFQYMERYKFRFVLMFIFAIAGTIFNIADSWSLTIDLSTINALQLQVDSGKALPHLDKTILHTHSLKSAYNLISGEACCKSKGCTLDSQIHKNRRYVNSLASRQKHLRTGTIGKSKPEVLYRHNIIQ